MKIKLWGNKSKALFDWWSFGHVFVYFILTKLLLMEFPFEQALLILIGLGYGWEVIERIFEEWSLTKRFFSPKEGWINRYIGDIIADVMGFLLAWFI